MTDLDLDALRQTASDMSVRKHCGAPDCPLSKLCVHEKFGADVLTLLTRLRHEQQARDQAEAFAAQLVEQLNRAAVLLGQKPFTGPVTPPPTSTPGEQP